MRKLIYFVAMSFIVFIVWVIYMADTDQVIIFFRLVQVIPYGDKIGHVLLFGLLTLAVIIVTRFNTITLRSSRLFIGTVIVSLFVVSEELSQHFISSRTLDVADLLADGIGIVTFTMLAQYMNKGQMAEKVT